MANQEKNTFAHSWRGLRLLAVLPACVVLSAVAAPQPGIGIAVGPVVQRVRLHAPVESYTFTGLGFTADEQYVLSDLWSFNAFGQVAAGTSSGDISQNIINAQAGLEMRFWRGDGFWGPSMDFSLEQRQRAGTATSNMAAPGLGMVAGWEGPRGLTLTLQVDAPQILFVNGNDQRFGAWLRVGYRWR